LGSGRKKTVREEEKEMGAEGVQIKASAKT
jgi:hypothetical protein